MIELTKEQKRFLLDYMLHSGKGIFEDYPEFWNTLPDAEDNLPKLQEAVNKYVDELKQRLLGEL